MENSSIRKEEIANNVYKKIDESQIKGKKLTKLIEETNAIIDKANKSKQMILKK